LSVCSVQCSGAIRSEWIAGSTEEAFASYSQKCHESFCFLSLSLM